MNHLVEKNLRAMNDPLTKLAGATEPHCHPDQNRAYDHPNVPLIDFKTYSPPSTPSPKPGATCVVWPSWGPAKAPTLFIGSSRNSG